MKKFIICLLIISLTSFATYRVVMHNIEICVNGDTAYLTVFGQTDMYYFAPSYIS